MYRVEGQTQYTLDHDVSAWDPDWDSRTRREMSIIIPEGTFVEIVDEDHNERGRTVCFVANLSTGTHIGVQWCADADDFWDVPEVEAGTRIGYEAKCGACGETFIPHGPDDLIHVQTEAEVFCGGQGELLGAWHK